MLFGKAWRRGLLFYSARPELSINRDAAIVTVRARHSHQREVEDYLESIRASVSRQVLIEATVVEINLFDRFEAGVDWR